MLDKWSMLKLKSPVGSVGNKMKNVAYISKLWIVKKKKSEQNSLAMKIYD